MTFLSTKRVMFLGTISLLLVFPLSSSIISIGVIEHARFDLIDPVFHLIDASSVISQWSCTCQCYTYSMCGTATYSEVTQLCSLFSAYLWQGQLQVVPKNQRTSTITFHDKSVAGQ